MASRSPLWRRAAEALIALVGLTIAAGGFVAGTRAGLVYNTFPLMGGRLVPADYAQLHPFFRNWFDNLAAVQFDHRVLAMTTFRGVCWSLPPAGARALPTPARIALWALLAAAALQVALGVSTLLLVVPIPLAAAHQAGAVFLLSAAIVFRHTLRHGENVWSCNMPFEQPDEHRFAMTIDTLGYTKALEAAGVDRQAAEAQAEAMASTCCRNLVTKADLDIAIERLEHRLTLRLIGIVGAFDAALFALLRFVH